MLTPAALAAVRAQLREIEAEGRKRALSTHGVVVSVAPEECACPRCGGRTLVQKSTEHSVVTLEHGPFTASETVRVCARKCLHLGHEPMIREMFDLLVAKLKTQIPDLGRSLAMDGKALPSLANGKGSKKDETDPPPPKGVHREELRPTEP